MTCGQYGICLSDLLEQSLLALTPYKTAIRCSSNTQFGSAVKQKTSHQPVLAVTMAPKGKDSSRQGKGKGKQDDNSSAGGSGKLKAAQSINVRHILVGCFFTLRHQIQMVVQLHLMA